MERFLEGFVVCDDATFNFIFDSDKALHIRCLDIGKYFGSAHLENGARDFKKFLVNSRERKYFEFESLKKILSKTSTNKDKKLAFLIRLNKIFFGSCKRKFFFLHSSQKVKISVIEKHCTVKVDKEPKISLEDASDKYKTMSGLFAKFAEILVFETLKDEKELVETSPNGFVYILKDISKNPGIYKVGKATNLSQRLSAYCTGSSEKQEFERTYETGNCDLFERNMHYMFSDSRLGKTEMFKVPLQALEITADFLKCLDEIRNLNKKHILSEEFDVTAYSKEFESLLSGREAYRTLTEHKRNRELATKKILANLELLKKFVDKKGVFPEKTTDKKLYWFCVRLRMKYANRRTVPVDKRIIRAAEIIPGWKWDLRETKFEILCIDLDKWLEKNRCELTAGKNKNLYERLNTWKKAYRLSPNEKDSEYNDIRGIFLSHGQDFLYNPRDEGFLEKVEALREWMDNNDKKFPSSRTVLGAWLGEQRKNSTRYPCERRKIMDSMFPGWDENQNNRKWEENVRKTREYYQLHGHLPPKRNDPFLQNQRAQAKLEDPKREKQLTIEREKILDKEFPNWRDPLCEEEKTAKKRCTFCASE
ncbi:hypothetical protein A9K97_gp467 [Tokyovirus A1]|uniref:hypothetical protein n=1 Tax=Tokyovirus A1 TaxID=1826170 RepID=UPI0007A97353|nr:hypothetical protein A9K97_gp467 [Tokyovirus A1]BAU79884.1 hypothetical protein [Tokyovirus A1]